MSDTLVLAIFALLGLISAGVLVYARATNKDAAALVPPDLVHRLLDQTDRLLEIGLTSAALTPSTLDDQFFISALELRGWTVNGSADKGYTMTPPPAVTTLPPVILTTTTTTSPPAAG